MEQGMSVRWVAVIVVLVLLGFVIALAVTLVDRLSEQQVALIVGLACGAALALPVGAVLGAYLWSTRRAPRSDAAAPPIIYVTPPPVQPAGPFRPIGLADPSPPRRSFNVIGDSGFEDE
jgi:hypothetical protein